MLSGRSVVRPPVQVPRLQEAGNAALWGKLLGAALGAASDVLGGAGGGGDDDVQEFDEVSGTQSAEGVDFATRHFGLGGLDHSIRCLQSTCTCLADPCLLLLFLMAGPRSCVIGSLLHKCSGECTACVSPPTPSPYARSRPHGTTPCLTLHSCAMHAALVSRHLVWSRLLHRVKERGLCIIMQMFNWCLH